MNRSFRSASVAASVLSASALSYGCGAAKSIVNNNIPPVSDALRINGRSVTALVSRAIQKPTRAAIPGAGAFDTTFSDFNVSESNRLTSARFEQGVSKDVLVRFPSGAAQPDQFTVSGLILNVAVSEKFGNGQVSRNVTVTGMTADGPFQFNKVRDNGDGSANYTLASGSDIGLGSVQIGSDQTRTLMDILTEQDASGSNGNFVDGQFGFDADDSQLPEGTTVTFSFVNGQARVGI